MKTISSIKTLSLVRGGETIETKTIPIWAIIQETRKNGGRAREWKKERKEISVLMDTLPPPDL